MIDKLAGGIAYNFVNRLPAIKHLVAERNRLAQENQLLREQVRRDKLPPHPIPHIPSELKIGGLCEVMNPARYLDPKWFDLHKELEGYSADKHCFQSFNGAVYRKGWEWTHCIFGLRELGLLKPEHRAVGVGAGRECVIYYLADHISHVTATDLYGEIDWISSGGKEADLKLLEESKKYCPPTVDFSKISFETRDGTDLGYPDGSFDFAWSLSSIEHFGGHDAARRAVQEMGRVVRPGGVVAIATELLLLEEHSHPEFFTRSQIKNELVEPCAGTLELISDINFDTLTYDYLVDSIVFPSGRDRKRRHVVLNDGNVQWTSIFLFFRKRA
jgi:SAM-dependent methyltransferase